MGMAHTSICGPEWADLGVEMGEVGVGMAGAGERAAVEAMEATGAELVEKVGEVGETWAMVGACCVVAVAGAPVVALGASVACARPRAWWIK